jgi:inorganic triphosphatase YgiF
MKTTSEKADSRTCQLVTGDGNQMGKTSEIEAKYTCGKELMEADVQAALRKTGLTVSWLSPQQQEDTYFDSTDGLLLKASASFRLRRIGKVNVGALKLPKSRKGAVVEREETEWEITADEAQAWAAGSVDFSNIPRNVVAALQRLGVQSLAPVLNVLTFRRKGQVVGTGGFCVDLALDDVTFISASTRAKQWELELELRGGNADRLAETADTLRAELNLEASKQSKFLIGMEKVGRTKPSFHVAT